MKDLRNKSGILPAQYANSRVDCGIAWSEHRKAEKVKRDDVIPVEEPQLHIDPAEQGSDQTAVTAFTLKPIDPKTIKVGDTVRLVGSRTITEWPHSNLEVGKDYKVIYVDRNCNEGMAISVSYNVNMKYFWIYDEDLVLVESA